MAYFGPEQDALMCMIIVCVVEVQFLINTLGNWLGEEEELGSSDEEIGEEDFVEEEL